jgi:hypothetical protein
MARGAQRNQTLARPGVAAIGEVNLVVDVLCEFAAARGRADRLLGENTRTGDPPLLRAVQGSASAADLLVGGEGVRSASAAGDGVLATAGVQTEANW